MHNFDPWYEAFGVTEMKALYLPKKELHQYLVGSRVGS
jgi:predicted metalloendopeptidase